MAGFFLELHQHIAAHPAFHHVAHHLAVEGDFHRFREFIHRQPQGGYQGTVVVDLHLGDGQLGLQLQVHHSLDRLDRLLHGLADAAQLAQVGAVDLDGNGAAHPGEHLIHAVGDEAADVGSHPGQLGKGLAQFGNGGGAIGKGQFAQFHIHVGQVHAGPIGVAGSPPAPHLYPAEQGIVLELPGERQAGPVGHLQGYPRVEHHGIHQGLFAKFRQEHPTQGRQDQTGGHHQGKGAGQHP